LSDTNRETSAATVGAEEKREKNNKCPAQHLVVSASSYMGWKGSRRKKVGATHRRTGEKQHEKGLKKLGRKGRVHGLELETVLKNWKKCPRARA